MFFNPSFDGSDTTLKLGFFICENAMFSKFDLMIGGTAIVRDLKSDGTTRAK